MNSGDKELTTAWRECLLVLLLMLILLRHRAKGPEGRVFLSSASTLPGWVVRTESGGEGSLKLVESYKDIHIVMFI